MRHRPRFARLRRLDSRRAVAIQLAPGQSSGVLTLTNEGDKPLHAQVRVFAWNQATGSDSLDPTDALVASPR